VFFFDLLFQLSHVHLGCGLPTIYRKGPAYARKLYIAVFSSEVYPSVTGCIQIRADRAL
jgi:hypothetical protein